MSGTGLHDSNPYEYLGFDYGRDDATIVDDGRDLSQWECVACFYANVAVPSGNAPQGMYQFSYDPEMHTKKGGGKK